MPSKLLSTLAKWIKPQGNKIHSNATDKNSGLNVNEGIARLGGDRALYVSLLHQLKDRYANVAEELIHLAENDDWQGMSHKAHMIKGIAGNLGAHKLFISAEALEIIDMNNLGSVKTKLAIFKSDLNEVLKVIESIS